MVVVHIHYFENIVVVVVDIAESVEVEVDCNYCTVAVVFAEQSGWYFVGCTNLDVEALQNDDFGIGRGGSTSTTTTTPTTTSSSRSLLRKEYSPDTFVDGFQLS